MRRSAASLAALARACASATSASRRRACAARLASASAALLGVVAGDVLRQRPGFGVERGQRGMGLAREFAFVRAVVRDTPLLRRQIVEPLERRAFLALQSHMGCGRLGECVALRLRVAARGGDARRNLGLRFRDGFEFVLRGLHRRLGGIGVAARLIGGGGGVAPACIDQPPLGNADIVAELRISSRARACRRSALARSSISATISERRVRLVSVARSFCSASLRRTCSPAIPAASSSIARRSVGFAAMTLAILPWLTSAGLCRPGRGVGEDQRDVLCAHVTAIGAIGRSRAALDPADDLEIVAVAAIRQSRDERALGVAMQRDFGKVARRAR